MTMSTMFNAVLVLAVVALVVSRRMRWQELAKSGKDIWVGPAVIAGVGLLQLKNKIGADTVLHPVDLLFLVAGLLAALGAGVLLGRLSEVRVADGKVFSRMGVPAVGVWVGFIAVRVLLGFLGHALGAQLSAGGGAIMLSLGASLLTQSLVLGSRTGQLVRR
ncbi:hypothetical protein JOF53_002841 [Crossiella equi]|uniref:DUF1453 domain-containing protein n=1 Tax=Crossiella equi TaxID=130796 RepID=A0ABS5ABL5_9PSEU|nr:DUF1453 family protein [Crossiella equi]MBP2473969.1 hypothetical protein [Crossiella equi]